LATHEHEEDAPYRALDCALIEASAAAGAV
jgi:hypothetical protein